ncbi:uncharacterized protein MONOS_7983 [Monocercomonoides exilis]|uniref:uncharacterized protein n=1 Tax=Monocercomonoides exilis TaxID=2049356 RepID=UPI0035595A12|nr:hypothetical protein MONOS_7983 [Monocercomonoides exilis]|eukprot:MONOS_7983.1-p1 / transcript=MONOS_7983.1 / gene=MONOS_7983 / organism=Monocercomonoides_exilis_PA203 / gene_product=unspecified product / transcript_product=unspecified product / location=Mono_scaffold00289:24579-26007(-) / protein_length=433 / sequence_SO=supercontig / SO=protein_coding / is_pseudo=false
MEEFIDDKIEDGNREMAPNEKFSKLLEELKSCSVSEQKEKIEEMNELMEEMGEEEFKSVFTKEWFNEMDKMIEEKILSWENAILLLKHVGYCQTLKCFFDFAFKDSFLSNRFQEMIIEEKMMIEEKDEKLLVDLCECYLLSNRWPSPEMSSIIVPCLLKVASKKEEDEETQKEVEMALLALSNIGYWAVEQKLHLNEIKTIIEYHQEHHNLTRLAYQLAWSYLICRSYYCKSLEDVVVNELHFIRESIRELEELWKSVDWKRKEEEMGKTERKTMDIISRWIGFIHHFFNRFHLENEEYVGLFSCQVDVFRASRDNHDEIGKKCVILFNESANNLTVKVDDLLKSGAIDVILEELHRPTLNKGLAFESLKFFYRLSLRFKGKEDDEMEEAKRKELKRKMLEKMEEKGVEDNIINFQISLKFFYAKDDGFFHV